MADEKMRTLRASFTTREAAVQAVEHLVQQHGIPRADIFVRAEGSENTAGSRAAGSDVAHQHEADAPLAPLHGVIEVSVDITEANRPNAEKAFRDAGAMDVTIH